MYQSLRPSTSADSLQSTGLAIRRVFRISASLGTVKSILDYCDDASNQERSPASGILPK